MKYWWLEHTDRLALERRLIDEVVAEGWFQLERWGHDVGLITAFGTIICPDAEHAVKLTYPDQFPHVPAWVMPRTPKRLSGHQYGEGVLCLELRPDNWVPSATGADVLRSARNLLATEKRAAPEDEQSEVPSAGFVGEIQAYGWLSHPILISAGCAARIHDGTSKGLIAARYIFQSGTPPIYVYDDEDVQRPCGPSGPDLTTGWASLPIFVSPVANPWEEIDRTTLALQMSADALALEALARSTVLVMRPSATTLTAQYVLAESNPSFRSVHVLPEQTGLRSNRAEVASAKKVAIVGAGSIGSKIAESLVRSGVRSLVLLDGDVMLPANIERHSLDWRHVGSQKVRALSALLKEITQDVRIETFERNLNWQQSAKLQAETIDAIAACDVIVDATADHAVSLLLGAIAFENGKAFVAAEVFEGGIGALIASCIRGRDVPFAEAKSNFMAWCEQQNSRPPQATGRTYEALAEDGTPVQADDAAVSVASAHASRVILDILDGDPAPADASWMLIGLKKAWLFTEGHGQVIRLNVGGARPELFEPIDDGTRKFIMDVIKEIPDAS